MPIHLSPRPIRAALRRLANSRRFWLLAGLTAAVVAVGLLNTLHGMAPVGSAQIAR
jgi:hypothetical protein